MRKVVHLRIFKGIEILRKEDGTIRNENQIVKVLYDTIEWRNYISRLPYGGNCKVDVLRVLSVPDYQELDKTEINDEVQKAFLNKPVLQLTEQEKTIEELKSKINMLIKDNAKANKKEPINEVDYVDDYVAPLTYDNEEQKPISNVKEGYKVPLEESMKKAKVKTRKAKRVTKK